MKVEKMTSLLNSTDLMPVLFLGHGSPMNAIEENEFVAGFRKLSKEITKPNAILCISAHWETRGTYITAMEKPKTIHDFGGFPKKLFDVQYPSPGNPVLAQETKNMVTNTNIKLDDNWGLDHGVWSIVKHMYPEANIPIIQMSLDYRKSPQFHFDLAKELSPLRQKGVLIIGSGNLVHNLKMIKWDKLNEIGFGYDWALEANDKLKKIILDENYNALINYEKQDRVFDLAIPSPEHYLPLIYAIALKNKNDRITIFNDKAIGGSLTMTSINIMQDE